MQHTYKILLLLCMATLIACTSSPRSRKELIEATRHIRLPASKSTSKALVYLLRSNSAHTDAAHMVYLDNPREKKKYRGSLKSNQYLYLYLSPGTYRIYVLADNGSWLDLNARKGVVYFIEIITEKNIARGLIRLRFIDFYQGKLAIKELSPGVMRRK